MDALAWVCLIVCVGCGHATPLTIDSAATQADANAPDVVADAEVSTDADAATGASPEVAFAAAYVVAFCKSTCGGAPFSSLDRCVAYMGTIDLTPFAAALTAGRRHFDATAAQQCLHGADKQARACSPLPPRPDSRPAPPRA